PGLEPYDIGEIQLVREEDLADPRALALAEGVVLGLAQLARRATAASLSSEHHRLCPYEFSEALPLLDEVATPSAEAYASRFLSPLGLGRFLPGWKSPIPFEKALASRVTSRSKVDVHALSLWFDRHLELSWTSARKDA